jgi:phosphate transport system ATP-binding protein
MPQTPSPDASAIRSENLSVFYGDAAAVKSVNLGFEANKVSAIIGPSGCGKSTFIRALNRMNDLVPGARVEGSVFYRDVDIYGDKVHPAMVRRHIGMVFQKPNPFPRSLFDNIAYGLRIGGDLDKREIKERVLWALEKAHLLHEVEDRLDEPGTSLSGGQQQRLCIARALAVKPDILLMDEPCSALDPIATAKIEDLILELRKDYTVVIVTHNMQQAARVSDYTAYFYLGELIEFARTERIFEAPKDERTEAYITGRFG